MRTRGFCAALAALVAFATQAACSSTASSPTGTADPDSGAASVADAGADTAPTGTSITAWVVEQPADATATTTPLAGATVSLDIGATHRERAADEQGKVTFDGVDFSQGEATLTAFVAGRTIVSYVGVTPEHLAHLAEIRKGQKNYPPAGGDLTFTLPRLFTPNSVHLTGTVTNKLDPQHWTVWTASRGPAGHRANSGTFDIPVVAGRPLTLVAWEFAPKGTTTGNHQEIFRWSSLDLPALTTATQTDYDWNVAKPLTATTVHGKVVLPQGTSSLIPSVVTTNAEGGIVAGEWTDVAPGAGNAWDFTAQVAAVSLGSDHLISVATADQSGGSQMVSVALGPMTEGMTFDQFIAPPKAPKSIALGESVPIGADAAIQGAQLRIVDPATKDPVWIVRSPVGFAVPAGIMLPTLQGAAAAMLPSNIEGRLEVSRGPINGELLDVPTAVSRSATFSISH